MMSEWLDFKGSAADNGGVYNLTPDDSNGCVEFDKADVQVSGGFIKIRNGATGRIIINPIGQEPADKSALNIKRSDCPDGRTMCIGLVMMCCGSGKVLGPCIGVWGC